MKKQLIMLFPILLIGLIAYIPSLQYGFSQDDFIHLYASNASSFDEVLNFFNPFYQFSDIFFYRPLTTQLYFFINRSIFGLNPLPMHIEAPFLHLINSFLIFVLINKVWKDKKIAFISSFFYAVSASHFLSLYYISAFQQIGKTFFIFLTILLFISYQEHKKRLFLFGSLFTFLAALASKETSIILPFLLIPLEIIRRKDEKAVSVAKETVKRTIQFVFVTAVYISIRLVGLKSVFYEGSYDITFAPKEIFQNIKWYILWSLGLPEILSTYPSLKPQSLIQFGKDLPLGEEVLVLFLILLISLAFLTIKSSIIYKHKKVFISSIILFFIPFIPVLPLYQHRYPHYLDISFLGLFPIIGYFIRSISPQFKIISFLIILSFTLLQLCSIQLTEQTHWTTHRAKVASYYYSKFTQNYPTLPHNTIITFVGSKKSAHELSVALAYHYAFSVWYPKKIKEVQYKTDQTSKVDDKEIIFPITVY